MTDALRAVPAFRVLSKFILATGQEIGWEQACSFCGLTCIQHKSCSKCMPVPDKKVRQYVPQISAVGIQGGSAAELVKQVG
jgi:hypothetical protein